MDSSTKTVTLTHEQWSTLCIYLLSTTQYRKGEQSAWEKLAQETNEDGTPRFRNAADNAQYWADMDEKLTKILKAIMG